MEIATSDAFQLTTTNESYEARICELTRKYVRSAQQVDQLRYALKTKAYHLDALRMWESEIATAAVFQFKCTVHRCI